MNIRIGSGQQELRIFSTASLRVFHDLIILKNSKRVLHFLSIPFFGFQQAYVYVRRLPLKSLRDGAEINLFPSIFNTCLPCLQN
jgi:hypothetical protein